MDDAGEILDDLAAGVCDSALETIKQSRFKSLFK